MAKLLFVQNVWHECQGPMFISAVLKQRGHHCAVTIAHRPRAVLRAVRRHRPDVVGFSVLTGHQDWAFEMARRIKARFDLRTLFGNAFATLNPEIVQRPEVDVVCRGEGEHAVAALMDGIGRGEIDPSIPGLWLKQPDGAIHRNELGEPPDLDALPWCDRELYADHRSFRMMPTVVAVDRNCPGDCAFCFEPVMREVYRGKGPFYRHRDPGAVVAELKHLRDHHLPHRRANRTFTLGSDYINCNPRWFTEFLRRYRDEVGVPFFCGLGARSLDAEQARLLRAAGCRLAGFGLETGDERLRNGLLNKQLSDEAILGAASLLHEHGVPFVTGNMIGLPGETLEQAWKTLELNARIEPSLAVAFILQPYPGTAIERYALENGHLASSDAWAFARTMHGRSVLDLENMDELSNLHRLFTIGVQYPFLLPVIRRLVRLPPNRFFEAVFLASHTLVYTRRMYELSVPQLAWYASRFLHYLGES